MAKQYRVKSIFDHREATYTVFYVIQKKGPLGLFWWTVSEPIDNLERIEKDCKEAQELYDKYDDQ